MCVTPPWGHFTELPVSDRSNDSRSIVMPVLTGSPVVGHVIEIELTRSSSLGTSTVAAWALPAQRATAKVSRPSHRVASDMVGGRHAEPDRPATIRSATVV